MSPATYEQTKKARIWLCPGDGDTAKVLAFLRVAAPIVEGEPGMLESVLELADHVIGDNSTQQIEHFLFLP